MRIVIVGPGRAATALGLAVSRGGHTVVGVSGRDPQATARAATLMGTEAIAWEATLPAADLAVIGVRDDAIGQVAAATRHRMGRVGGAVHLSGLTPLAALESLAAAGIPVGAFHPLQSFPDAEAGANHLAGAWIAITTEDPGLRLLLGELAGSIGAHPFDLADASKPLYHAGAAAASNFVVAVLALAEDLLAAAGVPWRAAAPLVLAVVENCFQTGARASLTGPIARGDVGTVQAQLDAVAARLPERREDFLAFANAVVRLANRSQEFAGVLR